MGKPFAPGVRVVGDIEQYLFTDSRRAPALPIARAVRRQDHHQFLGVQAMADQPGQVVGGHADGRVDLAGVEIDCFDA